MKYIRINPAQHKHLEKLLTGITVTGQHIESIKGLKAAIRIDKDSVVHILKLIQEGD